MSEGVVLVRTCVSLAFDLDSGSRTRAGDLLVASKANVSGMDSRPAPW
jgi:hypothetical protein